MCEDNQRPMILPHWHDKDVLHKMTQLMKDCWYKMPASRLTALRIKKTIGGINSDEKNGYIMWMTMVQESEESGKMLLNWSPPVLRVASETVKLFFWYKLFSLTSCSLSVQCLQHCKLREWRKMRWRKIHFVSVENIIFLIMSHGRNWIDICGSF